MNCDRVRRRLMDGRDNALPAAAEEHLLGCPTCARFADRLGLARGLLRQHHAGAEPDGGFAARVIATLPSPPSMLSWAAARLLPTTLALVLALAAWSLVVAPGVGSLLQESPTDDLLAWVLSGNGGLP